MGLSGKILFGIRAQAKLAKFVNPLSESVILDKTRCISSGYCPVGCW
jgi:hypothetical protein